MKRHISLKQLTSIENYLNVTFLWRVVKEIRGDFWKRYNPDQIIRVVDELKAGKSADEICRVCGIAQRTLYRWKSQDGEMNRLLHSTK
jgi:hypothetical protein